MKNYGESRTRLIVIQTFFIIFIGFKINKYVCQQQVSLYQDKNKQKSFKKNTTMK